MSDETQDSAVVETQAAEVAPEAVAEPAPAPEPAPTAPVAEPEPEPAPEPAVLDDADLIDAMNEQELRAYITERDGKAPHHKLKFENLLALAKNPPETAKEREEEAPSLANPDHLGTVKIYHPEGATSVSYDGRTYEADEEGEITVPVDAFADLADHGFLAA